MAKAKEEKITASQEVEEEKKKLDGKEKTNKVKKKKKAQDSEAQTAQTDQERPKLKSKFYEKELARLQVELFKLQEWVIREGLKVVVIFEGRDAAGKGGVITRITQNLNPRVCRVVALPKPTERERAQWYFQRYITHLPAAGEIVLLDRSWYNRAGVERVMGFCTDEEYQEFLRSCPCLKWGSGCCRNRSSRWRHTQAWARQHKRCSEPSLPCSRVFATPSGLEGL